jgi:nucleotide-binding universal stress UspA family protein
MKAILKILVPTDFSPAATAAARYAVDLAAKLDARVTLMHVYWPTVIGFPDGSVFLSGPIDLANLLDASRRGLEGVKSELPRDVPIALESRQGAPAETIAEVSREFDLIVMATHGRSGVSHLILGSVAERVVRTAHCPVVTVRVRS